MPEKTVGSSVERVKPLSVDIRREADNPSMMNKEEVYRENTRLFKDSVKRTNVNSLKKRPFTAGYVERKPSMTYQQFLNILTEQKSREKPKANPYRVKTSANKVLPSNNVSVDEVPQKLSESLQEHSEQLVQENKMGNKPPSS